MAAVLKIQYGSIIIVKKMVRLFFILHIINFLKMYSFPNLKKMNKTSNGTIPIYKSSVNIDRYFTKYRNIDINFVFSWTCVA